MDVRYAYKTWAEQYDTDLNKTRDLEGVSLRETLSGVSFNTCLEIGCGTGKNTCWLLRKADKILAVDFSEEMLQMAHRKITSDKVDFEIADIDQKWTFTDKYESFDLIVFSLVLEHIHELSHIFRQSAKHIKPGGYMYIGELHSFKQYTGSKARYDTEDGRHFVSSYTHNVSDYTTIAARHGFKIVTLNEYFDNNDRTTVPRIMTMLFSKSNS